MSRGPQLKDASSCTSQSLAQENGKGGTSAYRGDKPKKRKQAQSTDGVLDRREDSRSGRPKGGILPQRLMICIIDHPSYPEPFAC